MFALDCSFIVLDFFIEFYIYIKFVTLMLILFLIDGFTIRVFCSNIYSVKYFILSLLWVWSYLSLASSCFMANLGKQAFCFCPIIFGRIIILCSYYLATGYHYLFSVNLQMLTIWMMHPLLQTVCIIWILFRIPAAHIKNLINHCDGKFVLLHNFLFNFLNLEKMMHIP